MLLSKARLLILKNSCLLRLRKIHLKNIFFIECFKIFVFMLRERMAQAKMNRKADKKMKENLLLLEDERRHADQYKEQAEKVRSKTVGKHRQNVTYFYSHYRSIVESKL